MEAWTAAFKPGGVDAANRTQFGVALELPALLVPCIRFQLMAAMSCCDVYAVPEYPLRHAFVEVVPEDRQGRKWPGAGL